MDRHRFEELKQRWAFVPSHVRACLSDVIAQESTGRNEHHFAAVELRSEVAKRAAHSLKCGGVKIHLVHLVNDDAQLANPPKPCQVCVPSCLRHNSIAN